MARHEGLALGGSVFAATVMVVLGLFQAIMGVTAIAKDHFYITTRNYVFDLDTTSWGWIHLVLGALVLLCGIFLFRRTSWAAVIAIVLAGLSAVNNFFFLPYYPLWAIVVIALDIFVIWSLATILNTRAGLGTGTWQPPTSQQRWPGDNVPGRRHRAATDSTAAEPPHQQATGTGSTSAD